MAMFDESTLPANSPDAGGEYLVLARKYRPQTFDDLIGQEHVVRTLKNAIERNRVHHAYLFTGSRGLGKTSAARILAKALNCEKGPTPTPCGECSVCRQIAMGRGGEAYVVNEIDGASNGSVDDARELRSTINQRTGARYHVIIIDEVHMLSTAAFNALLKTLEEPPAHVKFVFATTEVQKVPETIISRCQRFDFRRVPASVIGEHLANVARVEGIDADAESLKLIARVAEGGMRDSLSKLDQAIAFCGNKISATDIERIFGILSRQNLLDLIAGFRRRDFELALTTAARIHEEGLDAAQVMRDLIDLFRDLVIVKTCGAQSPLVDAMAEDRERMAQVADGVPVDTFLYAVEILAEGLRRIRTTGFPRLSLEMTFIKLAELEDLIPVPQLLDALVGQAPLQAAVGTRRMPAPSKPLTAPPAPASPTASPAPSSAAGVAADSEGAEGAGGRRNFADDFKKTLQKKNGEVTPISPAAARTPLLAELPTPIAEPRAAASDASDSPNGDGDEEPESEAESAADAAPVGNEFAGRMRRPKPSFAPPTKTSAPDSAGVAQRLRDQDSVRQIVQNFEGEIIRVEEND